MSGCISFHFLYYGAICCDYVVNDILFGKAVIRGRSATSAMFPRSDQWPCYRILTMKLISQRQFNKREPLVHAAYVCARCYADNNRPCVAVVFHYCSVPQRKRGFRSIAARWPLPRSDPSESKFHLLGVFFVAAGIIIIISTDEKPNN